MNPHYRPRVVLILLVLLAAAFALASPLHQLADYHAFADRRSWLGIPNALDVLSNLGFALAGTAGLLLLWRSAGHVRAMGLQRSRSGYGLFFLALLLTAAGSTWYHLQPDDARLVWDRLPIALACAALLDAVLSEQLPLRLMRGLRLLFWLLAPLSIYWWHISADLAPYLYLQLLPLLLIPAVLLLYPSPAGEWRLWTTAIAAYVLAKLAELGDHLLYGLLGVISGHSLKHMLAALASLAIYGVLYRRWQRARQASPGL